jgi:hypothetical protein
LCSQTEARNGFEREDVAKSAAALGFQHLNLQSFCERPVNGAG